MERTLTKELHDILIKESDDELINRITNGALIDEIKKDCVDILIERKRNINLCLRRRKLLLNRFCGKLY